MGVATCCQDFVDNIELTEVRSAFVDLLLSTKGSPRHKGGGAEKVPMTLAVFLLDPSGGAGPLPIVSRKRVRRRSGSNWQIPALQDF